MNTVRFPLLRGSLLLIALAAIAFIMARGDNPAAAVSYNPAFSASVSDPNPGAAADIKINFSVDAPDSFPNVKTKSSTQFIPRAWGIHTPETDGASAPPIGGVAGTFDALSTVSVLGNPCFFPIPVPFTMIDATPYTGYDAATGAYDLEKLTSALDIGDNHPGGVGYSGQFAGDPATLQVAGDVGLSLISFTIPDVLHNWGYPAGWPPETAPWAMDNFSTVYLDADHNRLVTPDDTRLTFSSAGTGYGGMVAYPAGSVVRAGDADTYAVSEFWGKLHPFPSDTKHTDPNGNGDFDVGEDIYQDVNWSGTVSYGDVRLFWFSTLGFGSIVRDLQLNGGVTHYPDFLNQMFPPSVVGEPLARQWGAKNVLGFTAVSLNIVTYRPGQLPGYPASLGYPNVVVLLNPVAPVDWLAITMTSELCTPLSLVSTNLGVSNDNPATLADESGFVRLTNPKAEKSHEFTLITTSQPDADDDGVENMLDTCPFNPNMQEFGRTRDPDNDQLDGACDPDPISGIRDQDMDSYGNRPDNCATVQNGIEQLDIGYQQIPGFTFFYGIYGDNIPIGGSNQTDTDGDDIGDACEGAEAGAQCLNAAGDDDDGAVNDGCPTNVIGPETGAQCSNSVDDDGDSKVNDGCPQVPLNPSETGAQCLNSVDDDGDGKVNDGCPVNGAAESGWRCDDALDNEPGWQGGPDGYVNDGCPEAGGAEDFWGCLDALDNDGDGYVNDGCPTVSGPGSPETACDNALDDDADGLVNDGCPAVDPGDYARTHITGDMIVVTLTQGVPIAKHGVKLDDLDGKESVALDGSANYKVSLENKGGSAEDFPVAVRVIGGCGTVSGPATVHVNGDASANAQYTVDFSGCAAGEYTVQADACHAGDAAPAGLFGEGACPGASDGLADTNTLDDAPRSLTVVVGSP